MWLGQREPGGATGQRGNRGSGEWMMWGLQVTLRTLDFTLYETEALGGL